MLCAGGYGGSYCVEMAVKVAVFGLVGGEEVSFTAAGGGSQTGTWSAGLGDGADCRDQYDGQCSSVA